jgi:predicted enzyme related to lactoylglutathione lyase
MPKVVHFEIPADDPDAAEEFYTKTFGWKVQKWDGPVDYWLLITGDEGEPGIDGAITRKQNPHQPTVNTIDVSNHDEYRERAIANGGKALTDKMAVPGIGYMSYLADLEGVTFGIMESDQNAK